MRRCLGCMEEIDTDCRVCPMCGYIQDTPPQEAYHLTPGTTLGGRYLVGRVLGYGGFGITYIGFDTRLERKTAIKEFLPSMLATRMPGDTEITVFTGEYTRQFEEGLERFQDEAERLAKFNGLPGIVDIYDNLQENHTAYIIMELLEGQDIKTILKANGTLPYETAKEIILSVCGTLEKVHEEGMIHRDISPDNIYLTADGKIQVIDFGAARYETSKNSKSLSVILKSGYAPEEQYRSRGEQGPWSDVYALGASFYKMITGVTPQDSMERAVKDELMEPSALGVSIPPSEENALMNALAVRARDRTQNMAQFREELLSDISVRNKIKKDKNSDGKMSVRRKVISACLIGAALLLGLLAATGTLGEGGILEDTFGSALEAGYMNAPGIVNLSQTEAKKAVENAGLSYLVVGKEYSEKIEKDKVLTQEPLPGRPVALGDSMEVIICGGLPEAAEMDEMPDVVYLDWKEAQERLQEEGIHTEKQFEYDPSVMSGLVIRQEEKEETGHGGKTVLLTISLGNPFPKEGLICGIPFLDIVREGELLYLSYIPPLKVDDSLQTVFEYTKPGENNYTEIPSLVRDSANGRDRFSNSQTGYQTLVLDEAIMDLAGNQTVGEEEYLVRGAVKGYQGETVITPCSQTIRIEKKKTSAEIRGIEEIQAEEQGNYKYRILGTFEKGTAYYLYGGLAARDGRMVIHAEKEGELILETDEKFDGSTVLARMYPLYSISETENGGFSLSVGTPAAVDGTALILNGKVDDFRGMTVLDAIEQIENAAGPYRYRIPYRFSYVFDDSSKRGTILDYYMEGDPDSGEIYRLDIVVSNGRKGAGQGDMIVPVQWIPGDYVEEGIPYYATLMCFVMQQDPDEDSSSKCIYVEISNSQGENWAAAKTDFNKVNGYLRTDGYSRERYIAPEGYINFSAFALSHERAGDMNIGEQLRARLTPSSYDGNKTYGESAELEIPANSDLESQLLQ